MYFLRSSLLISSFIMCDHLLSRANKLGCLPDLTAAFISKFSLKERRAAWTLNLDVATLLERVDSGVGGVKYSLGSTGAVRNQCGAATLKLPAPAHLSGAAWSKGECGWQLIPHGLPMKSWLCADDVEVEGRKGWVLVAGMWWGHWVPSALPSEVTCTFSS